MLHTENLAVGYGERAVLRGVSLHVRPGEILCLIGPNGAGKSTLLKTLMRELPPLSGSVRLAGRMLQEIPQREFAKSCAAVFTGIPRTELMTCGELVAMGRYPYTGRLGILSEDDKRAVDAAMELVHVTEIADRDYNEISDGQRQRVLLARAICQEPQIMILDEPTSYLDIRHKLEFLDLLRSLTREKEIGVIMSMHELELAHLIADKVICISGDGKVEKVGSPEEVFTDELISRLYSLEDGRLREVYSGFVKSIENNG
jgi:iron complex transport system ATP-binding protein